MDEVSSRNMLLLRFYPTHTDINIFINIYLSAPRVVAAAIKWPKENEHDSVQGEKNTHRKEGKKTNDHFVSNTTAVWWN